MRTRQGYKWMDRAMCAAAGPKRWEEFSYRKRAVICRGCPVRQQCAQWLTNTPPPPSKIISEQIRS